MATSRTDHTLSTSASSSIRVRPARSLDDLDALASVYQRSFWDDPWWRYLYLPRIDEASSEDAKREIEAESLRQCRASLRRFLVDSRNQTFVAVDEATEQIAGFAGWILPDTSLDSALRPISPFEKLQHYILKIYDTLAVFLVPRGFGLLLGYTTPQSILCFRRQLDWASFVSSADAHHILPQHFQQGFFRLSLCGVLPQFSRRGIGQEMLKWGFGKADEQDRVLYISASRKGKGAYEKAGAKEIGRDICYEEDKVQGGWAEIVCRREKRSERKG